MVPETLDRQTYGRQNMGSEFEPRCYKTHPLTLVILRGRLESIDLYCSVRGSRYRSLCLCQLTLNHILIYTYIHTWPVISPSPVVSASGG